MPIHAPTVALLSTAALALGGLTAINVIHTAEHEQRQAVISELRSDIAEAAEREHTADEAAKEASTATVEVRVLITEQDAEFASVDGFIE